jgi:hypothetical protein
MFAENSFTVIPVELATTELIQIRRAPMLRSFREASSIIGSPPRIGHEIILLFKNDRSHSDRCGPPRRIVGARTANADGWLCRRGREQS